MRDYLIRDAKSDNAWNAFFPTRTSCSFLPFIKFFISLYLYKTAKYLLGVAPQKSLSLQPKIQVAVV